MIPAGTVCPSANQRLRCRVADVGPLGLFAFGLTTALLQVRTRSRWSAALHCTTQHSTCWRLGGSAADTACCVGSHH